MVKLASLPVVEGTGRHPSQGLAEQAVVLAVGSIVDGWNTSFPGPGNSTCCEGLEDNDILSRAGGVGCWSCCGGHSSQGLANLAA